MCIITYISTLLKGDIIILPPQKEVAAGASERMAAKAYSLRAC